MTPRHPLRSVLFDRKVAMNAPHPFDELELTLPDGVTDSDYEAAVALVESGYRAILAEFTVAKQRGVIPSGRLLSEMITSTAWTPPPLLTSEKFARFCNLTRQYMPTGILTTIWNIVLHFCGEQRLVPSITIEHKTGHVVVALML